MMWRSFACVVVLLVACSAWAHKEQSLDALVNERLGTASSTLRIGSARPKCCGVPCKKR